MSNRAARAGRLEQFSHEFGARVRAIRTLRGIGVGALANAIGVSPAMMSNIESGKRMPSISTLRKLGDCLEISLDGLFEPAGNDPRSQSTTARNPI